MHTRVAGQEISRTALAWETWGPGHLKTEPSGVPGSTHGVTGGKLRPGEGTKKPLAQAWILASASPAVTERRGRRGQSQQALAQCNAARAQGGKLLPPGQAPSGTQPSGPAPRSHQGANSGMAHRCPRWMPAPPPCAFSESTGFLSPLPGMVFPFLPNKLLLTCQHPPSSTSRKASVAQIPLSLPGAAQAFPTGPNAQCQVHLPGTPPAMQGARPWVKTWMQRALLLPGLKRQGRW